MLGSNHCRTAAEDSFVPVNPFLWPSFRSEHNVEHGTLRNAYIFVFDILYLIYLYLLLWLPSMYFSRVAKIFEDAGVTWADIQRMIDTMVPLPFPDEWTPPLVSPALIRFQRSWEDFIVSLIQEWKRLSVVSALLISAIFSMFQIPSAQQDPVTRTAGLLSLLCAMMGLTYGCIFCVRFGTMMSMYQVSKWAEEARKTDTLIWWNMYILLAMPLIWISWSMILFIFSVLSFLLRTGSVLSPDHRPPLSTDADFGSQIAIVGVFGVGMIYLVMIVKTLGSYRTRAAGMGAYMRVGGATHERQGMDVEIAMDTQGRERERRDEGYKREFSGHSLNVG